MDPDLREKGLQMRTRVLGAKYVQKAFGTADDFDTPFQDLLTEYGWGAVWTRPGLEPSVRSMLNLAMLSALNHPQELKVHIRGALTNGVTREQIREVFLQVAVYCGMPAAVEAFRCAREVFAEIDGNK